VPRVVGGAQRALERAAALRRRDREQLAGQRAVRRELEGVEPPPLGRALLVELEPVDHQLQLLLRDRVGDVDRRRHRRRAAPWPRP
jgi:hypothetical protein